MDMEKVKSTKMECDFCKDLKKQEGTGVMLNHGELHLGLEMNYCLVCGRELKKD